MRREEGEMLQHIADQKTETKTEDRLKVMSFPYVLCKYMKVLKLMGLFCPSSKMIDLILDVSHFHASG